MVNPHLRPHRAALCPAAVSAVLMVFGAAASGQTAPSLHLRALAATCAACHGTDGRAVPGDAMPRLAGLPESHIVTQMRAFRDGTRPATVMHQISKGYTDAQIESLAAYFAAIP